MTSYVVGFMFSLDRSRIALIRKNHPAWQRGRLNGIGGKINYSETAISAMCREFAEETGYTTQPGAWSKFCYMAGTNNDGQGFQVYFFTTLGDIDLLKTMEEEEVELHDVESQILRSNHVIENLAWLIPLALDHLQDGMPTLVHAAY